MRRLRSFLIVLTLAVAGCGPFSNPFLTDAEQESLSPQAKIFQLEGEMNILLKGFETYVRQPFCAEGQVVACADPNVVIRGTELADKVRVALEPAKAAVFAGGDNVASASAALRVAVAELSRYLLLAEISR